ncbi:MAG: beta-Ala-His dipeptidase, partial [Candidatus Kapaibacterium sp.]
MAKTIDKLEPKIVWEIFHEITKCPRPSKKEEKIIKYIEDFANNLDLPIKKDKLGNLVITKPASKGYEDKPTFCIQAHVDMVTEKNRDIEFDFDNDAIQTYIEDGWVKAKGTTLGADNGLGLAMGMAVLASKDLEHPRFELLCTLDEETGLTGAAQLGTDLLESEILINLDTEEFGHYTIGCAGGLNTLGTLDLVLEDTPKQYKTFELALNGLLGGHSGIEIDDERGNAAKILVRFVLLLNNKFNIRLHSFDSGNKHNAIPREAYVTFSLPENQILKLKAMVDSYLSTLKNEWFFKEPSIDFTLKNIDFVTKMMSVGTQDDLLNVINALPHGAQRYTPELPSLVQTSTNLAKVQTYDNKIEILTSQRSIVESEKFWIAGIVNSVFELGGFNITRTSGYPAWEPKKNSELVDKAVRIHKEIFKNEPVIEFIHAGLECGLIGEKYPHMEMLS